MPDTKQVKVILKNVPLFEGCSDRTLDEIAKIALELNLEKGQILYKPGDKADNFYVIANGIVTFINQGGCEFLNVQGAIKRTNVFGWAALIPEHPYRIGTAQTLEDSTLLSFNGAELLSILDKDPNDGYLVMKRLSAMITSTLQGKP